MLKTLYVQAHVVPLPTFPRNSTFLKLYLLKAMVQVVVNSSDLKSCHVVASCCAIGWYRCLLASLGMVACYDCSFAKLLSRVRPPFCRAFTNKGPQPAHEVSCITNLKQQFFKRLWNIGWWRHHAHTHPTLYSAQYRGLHIFCVVCKQMFPLSMLYNCIFEVYIV